MEQVQLLDTVIFQNTADEGGGIFARGSDAQVILYGCEINGNTAQRGGGFFSREIAVQMRAMTFSSNTALDYSGGGLFVENAYPFEFYDSQVTYNQGNGFYVNHGGGHKISGINVSHNTGYGLGTHYTNDYLGFNISNCEVFDNADGGIYLVGSSPVISNTYIVYNNGNTPGLQCQSGSSPMVVNSTIAYNRMNAGYDENSGSEIIVIDNSHPLLENTIVWGSDNMPDVFINAWWGRSTSIQVDHSIIRNDMSGILNPPLNETNYGEIIWGSGNVEGVSDPMFENAENFQVNVLSGSPAIDAGNPLPYYDDTDDTRNDIGYQGGRGMFVYLRGDDPDVYDAYYDDFNYTNFSPFYMGQAGINRSQRRYQLHIINNGNNNITLLDWMSSNSDFLIETYQSDNSQNFFPNTIESNSSSWINNVKQMWVVFYPSQPGNSESMLSINVSEENGRGYNLDFDLSASGYLIPEDVIQVPEDVPSIMFAVDNANSQDTIKVASGTYLGRIDFRDKELYLVGDKNNPPTIAYDREGNQESTVRIANAGNSLLRNFRIIGGKGDWCGGCSLPSGDEHSGGGIFIDVSNWNDQPSTIRLENLVVENNNAMYGGGVFVRKANLQMDNCIIRDNHTYNDQSHNRNGMGGALFMMHAQSSLPSKIKNTRFETNSAHEGGAVVLWQNSWGDHRVEFENVMINGNTSSLYSGVRAMDAKFSLMNSTIVDNHTTQGLNDGAGIHASNWSTGRIVNSIIHNNYPYNLSVGGVDGNYDSLLVSNSIVEHGSDSIQVFQNGFVDWQNSNLNVAPDLADDYGLLNYSVGIGEGSPSGTLYGWSLYGS